MSSTKPIGRSGSNDGPYPSQDLPVGVAVALRDGRAVQREQHGIPRPVPLEIDDEPSGHDLEGVGVMAPMGVRL